MAKLHLRGEAGGAGASKEPMRGVFFFFFRFVFFGLLFFFVCFGLFFLVSCFFVFWGCFGHWLDGLVIFLVGVWVYLGEFLVGFWLVSVFCFSVGYIFHFMVCL